MSAVWEDAPVSEGTLLVLLALADFANEKGICWPSVGSLAKMARLERRQVQYVLRKLEEKGLIAKEKMTGRYEPNIYKVLCGRGAISAPLDENQGRNQRHRGAQSTALRGAPQCAQTVTLEPSR
jgi:DNA-binding transcriptional ArsR family regulator